MATSADNTSTVELARLLSGYPQLITAIEQSIRDATSGALTTATTHSTKVEWSNGGGQCCGSGGSGGGSTAANFVPSKRPVLPATGCPAGTQWCAFKQRCIGKGEDCTAPVPVPPGPFPAHTDCPASAGYVWCPFKQRCIRPWEEDCTAPVPVPADKCPASAGYVWCPFKQRCIRPWEENCTAPVPVGPFPAVTNGILPGPSPAGPFPAVTNGILPGPSPAGPFPAVTNGILPGPSPLGPGGLQRPLLPAVTNGMGPDAHGCYASAGYSWCDSLKQCVRPWETPCPAGPTPPSPGPDPHGCYTSAGYVWCEQLKRCVRPWETPCSTPAVIADGGITPLPPVVPMPVDAPLVSLCDFSSPFLCSPAQNAHAPVIAGSVSATLLPPDLGSMLPSAFAPTEPAFAAGPIAPGGAVQWYLSGQPNLQYTSDFNPTTSQAW